MVNKTLSPDPPADTSFARRYGNRAIMLETAAAVPGMVGATVNHLTALRRMCDDDGWIGTYDIRVTA